MQITLKDLISVVAKQLPLVRKGLIVILFECYIGISSSGSWCFNVLSE